MTESMPNESTCVPNGFGLCMTHPVCDYMRGVVAELQAQKSVANEELAKQFRDSLAGETEGTLESLARSAKMLETYAPDLYPANDKGQVHFARAVMESVSDEIRKFLRNTAAAADTVPNRRNFDDELVCLLNKYSKENDSNTPDFILAEYVRQSLSTFAFAVVAREEWYGRGFAPGTIRTTGKTPLHGKPLDDDGHIQFAPVANAVPVATPLSREIAARVWCDKEMRAVVMDLDAAESIARIIDDVRHAQTEAGSYRSTGSAFDEATDGETTMTERMYQENHGKYSNELGSCEPLSTDPADFDGRRPSCAFCTDEFATKRCKVGGMLLCDECFQDWLNGRYDEPSPQDKDKPDALDHAFAEALRPEPTVVTPTVSSVPPSDPRTHEEARQFHEGFLCGAQAYAHAVGHSQLKSDNPKLREVFDAQGWKTIEMFEKIGAREADTCPDCGLSSAAIKRLERKRK